MMGMTRRWAREVMGKRDKDVQITKAVLSGCLLALSGSRMPRGIRFRLKGDEENARS